MKKIHLLGISGGPDSMYLLYKYHNKNIIVAHINYNKRSSSKRDQNIVEEFCKKNNIIYEILNVKEHHSNNFQSWARKKRYDFFQKIYKKYNCNSLILGHHKDDFLETALMQQESKRIPRFYGIREKNNIYNMNIYRPFLNIYFKYEILKKLEKNNIKYGLDETNEQEIYTRNRIRKQLNKKTLKQKQNLYSWFIMCNKILLKKFRRVDKQVEIIFKSDLELKFIRKLKLDINEILFEIIHKVFGEVKISKNKIESFKDFIFGKEGNKKFIINKKFFFMKKNGKLIYKKNI